MKHLHREIWRKLSFEVMASAPKMNRTAYFSFCERTEYKRNSLSCCFFVLREALELEYTLHTKVTEMTVPLCFVNPLFRSFLRRSRSGSLVRRGHFCVDTGPIQDPEVSRSDMGLSCSSDLSDSLYDCHSPDGKRNADAADNGGGCGHEDKDRVSLPAWLSKAQLSRRLHDGSPFGGRSTFGGVFCS